MATTLPIAALTVMLWMLWSEMARRRKSPRPIYALRASLYLIATVVLLFNLARYPAAFHPTARLFVILAAMVGLAGAVFFARRALVRS